MFDIALVCGKHELSIWLEKRNIDILTENIDLTPHALLFRNYCTKYDYDNRLRQGPRCLDLNLDQCYLVILIIVYAITALQ